MADGSSKDAMDGAASAMNEMFDFWRQGSEAFLKAQQDAMAGFTANMAPGAAAMAGNAMGANGAFGTPSFAFDADLFSFLDPDTWTRFAPDNLRSVLSSISKGPKFADLATPQAEAAEIWREMNDYQQASADFGKVVQKAWVRAFARYSEEYTLDDLQSGEMRGALDTWMKIANEELLDAQRSPEFMDAQRRMMRAGTEIRARQRDAAEKWSATYQMPTRTELDDLTRIVHELRRELRTTKRELAALRSEQSQ